MNHPISAVYILAMAIMLWLPVSALEAAIISVTTNIDSVPVPPSSACRLRAAIAAANGNIQVEGCAAGSGAEDFITLSGISGQTITLNGTALPTITRNISIFGFGVEVSGNDQSGIFATAGGSVDFSVNDLVIRNANADAAILHEGIGDLTITNSTVTNNSLDGVRNEVTVNSVFINHSQFNFNGGHGVYVTTFGGDDITVGVFDSSFLNNGLVGLLIYDLTLSANTQTVNIKDCLASGNQTGLAVGGTSFSVIDCTLSDNTRLGFEGSAIWSTTISQSTISGNGLGGVSIIDGYEEEPVEIINSTISGNGEFAVSVEDDIDVLLKQVTIADTAVGPSTIPVTHAAIEILSSSSNVGLINSLITNTTGGGPDCRGSGNLIINGVSIVPNPGDCDVIIFGSLLQESNLQLGPLQDNGGATFSHSPLPASLVIGAGDNAFSSGTYDQRGTGFPRILHDDVDIGAVETDLAPIVLPVVSLTLNDGVMDEAGPGTGSFTVTRTSDGPIDQPLQVFFTFGGSASNGVDYTAANQTYITPTQRQMTIPANATSISSTITPIKDNLVESTETLSWTLYSDQGTYNLGTDTYAEMSIVDDPVEVVLTLDDGEMDESALGTGKFTVTRSANGKLDAALPVSITFGGSASYGVDYTAADQTYISPTQRQMTIPANEASVSSTITPIRDLMVEGDETVTWTLYSDQGTYALGTDVFADMTIKDLIDHVFKDGFEDQEP